MTVDYQEGIREIPAAPEGATLRIRNPRTRRQEGAKSCGSQNLNKVQNLVKVGCSTVWEKPLTRFQNLVKGDVPLGTQCW